MTNLISNPLVNLNDKFILSFDVTFNKKKELIALGVEQIKRRSKTISALDTFLSKISQGIVIDNGVTVLEQSATYGLDGNYIYSKDAAHPNVLMGMNLEYYEPTNKVYEEVADPENFKLEDNPDVLIRNKKLYQYLDRKYIYKNDKFHRNVELFPITTIMSFEGGKLKKEYFYDMDYMLTYSGKIRFIINNIASTIDLARFVGDGYEKMESFFFTNQVDSAYIYLSYDVINPTNLSVTYST